MRRAAFTLAVLTCAAGGLAAQDFTTLKGHGGPIMALAVAEDGRVVSASFDNALGLWTGGAPVWLDGHAAAVNAVAVAPGVIVSGGDDFTVRLWEGDASRVLGQHDGKVAHLAVSPDGTRIASASWDGAIGVWARDGSAGQMLRGHAQGVNTVAFTADGQGLWSGSSDGTIRLWDLRDGSAVTLASHGFGVNEIVVGDGWLAYGAVDGGTRVIDAATGDEIADFTLDRRPILAMAHHAETGQIAVGDGQGYIMMLDAEAWAITRDFRATRDGPVWALAFSPDGATIWAGGIDDVVYGWPVALLDAFDPAIGTETRSFLRDADTMSNGERQFMRKCSICHALEPGPSRKAGPTLHGVFGRRAGTVEGYAYSATLDGSAIVWEDGTIDALFDEGPDHYIPGSKMPMQVIAGAQDRADLIAFLKQATGED